MGSTSNQDRCARRALKDSIIHTMSVESVDRVGGSISDVCAVLLALESKAEYIWLS